MAILNKDKGCLIMSGFFENALNAIIQGSDGEVKEFTQQKQSSSQATLPEAGDAVTTTAQDPQAAAVSTRRT